MHYANVCTASAMAKRKWDEIENTANNRSVQTPNTCCIIKIAYACIKHPIIIAPNLRSPMRKWLTQSQSNTESETGAYICVYACMERRNRQVIYQHHVIIPCESLFNVAVRVRACVCVCVYTNFHIFLLWKRKTQIKSEANIQEFLKKIETNWTNLKNVLNLRWLYERHGIIENWLGFAWGRGGWWQRSAKIFVAKLGIWC